MSEQESIADLVKGEKISNLVLVSGRSGAGKTSLINKLIEAYNGLELEGVNYKGQPNQLTIRKAKKHTTRTPRPDDDPEEFIYHSKDEFNNLVKFGYIEFPYQSEGVGNELYGWSPRDLRPNVNKIILLTANDDSVARDLKYFKWSKNIFVDASDEVLEQRIKERGGTPEQIANKIARLRKSHELIAEDVNGNEHVLDMHSQFYGTEDQLEGTANLIVENSGDLDLAADNVFREILRLNKNNSINVISEQRKLKVYKNDNGDDISEITTLASEDAARSSGVSHTYGNKLDKNREGYNILVTFGVVNGFASGMNGPQYFVRISNFEEDIDAFQERKDMFRGGWLRNIESWAIKAKPDEYVEDRFELKLVEAGMSYRHRSAGSDHDEEHIEVKSTYMNGIVPYRKIRKIFEEVGMKRLI